MCRARRRRGTHRPSASTAPAKNSCRSPRRAKAPAHAPSRRKSRAAATSRSGAQFLPATSSARPPSPGANATTPASGRSAASPAPARPSRRRNDRAPPRRTSARTAAASRKSIAAAMLDAAPCPALRVVGIGAAALRLVVRPTGLAMPGPLRHRDRVAARDQPFGQRRILRRRKSARRISFCVEPCVDHRQRKRSGTRRPEHACAHQSDSILCRNEPGLPANHSLFRALWTDRRLRAR